MHESGMNGLVWMVWYEWYGMNGMVWMVWYERSRLVHNNRKLKSVQRFATLLTALRTTKAYRTSPPDVIRLVMVANIPPIDLRIERVAALYFAKRRYSNGTILDFVVTFDRAEQTAHLFSLSHPAQRLPSITIHWALIVP